MSDPEAVNTSGLVLESSRLARVLGTSCIRFGRFLEKVGFDEANLNPPGGTTVDGVAFDHIYST